MVAYKAFKQEYEDYLDAFVGNESLLMKHKIEMLGSKYRARSVLKSMHENKIETVEIKLDLEKLDILKDRLMLDLMDNPKKLWKHLSVRVRNLWISRAILSIRILNHLKSEAADLIDGDFREVLQKTINKQEYNGAYWQVLKGFLQMDVETARNLSQFQKLFKSSDKNAFKSYFYNVFLMEGEEPVKKKNRVKLKKFDDF